jgi:5-formyltetrahydrofolate cyclo-ligase
MTLDPKSELRRQLRALRRRLAAAAPDAARLAAEALPLDRLPAFASYSGYHATGAEMDPSALIRRLAATGARFALPAATSPDSALEFRAFHPEEAMVLDAVNIPAPPPSAAVVHPDLVICPLLAFDRRGGRLGQGGGFYDRTLANLRACKPVFALGLAYAGQEVDGLLIEPHDERLDAILTEKGYIEVDR